MGIVPLELAVAGPEKPESAAVEPPKLLKSAGMEAELDAERTSATKPSEDAESLLKSARRAVQQKDWQAAEDGYHRVLNQVVSEQMTKDAMFELGRMLESHQAWAKAAIAYQAFLDRFHTDSRAAEVAVTLGRVCRELGAFKSALSHFYDALHSSFASTTKEKEIALQAQFEIAQTHFAKGDYNEARRFFERLVLLELGPEDRATAQFRLAQTAFLAGDLGETVSLARQFIADHPEAKQTAEARYLLSRALQKLGRSEESVRETLALLKQAKGRESADPDAWRTWQKRTGLEVANELYERGDAMNALTVYQRLAEFDTTPEWRIPIVYQIALCFERLRLSARAMEAYTFVIQAADAKPGAAQTTQANTQMMKEMAQWRIEYLRWVSDADRQLGTLLKPDWNTAAIQPLKFRESPVEPPAGATGKTDGK